MNEQKPSVGRIVHYRPEVAWTESSCAAIVTSVHSDTCINLAYFTPNGEPGSKCSVSYGEGCGHWSWPPRIPFGA